MTAKFQIETPEKRFPVFSNEMRPDLFVATVVYYVKPSKNQKEKAGSALKAGIHMEEGTTEARAFDRLKAWCVKRFGEPCTFSRAK